MFAVALALFWVRSVAWPLAPGRDAHTYFYFFYDMLNPTPEDPATMMIRTPLSPVFNVFLISVLGPKLAEILMSILYGLVITLLYQVGMVWGLGIARSFTGILLLHHAYGSMFHVVSNDPVVVILYAALCWSFLRACLSEKVSAFAASGLLVGLLLIARPGIFAVLAIVPLFLRGLSARARIVRAAVLCAGLLPFVLGWAYRNEVMFGRLSYSLIGDVVMPLCRVLQTDRMLDEENGPASRELFRVVEAEWLPALDPAYPHRRHLPRWLRALPQARGRDAAEYLSTTAVWLELVLMADRHWGQGHYEVLKSAAYEAISANPMKYVGGVARTFFETFLGNLKLPVPLKGGSKVFTHKGIVTLADRNVPHASVDESVLRQDGLERTAWDHLLPAQRKGLELAARLPTRDGVIWAGTWLNRMAYLFPPMLLWCFFGLVGCFFCVRVPDSREVALMSLVGVALLTNLAACMAQGTGVYQYRLPFDPIYILSGLLGLRAILRGRRTLRSCGTT